MMSLALKLSPTNHNVPSNVVAAQNDEEDGGFVFLLTVNELVWFPS